MVEPKLATWVNGPLLDDCRAGSLTQSFRTVAGPATPPYINPIAQFCLECRSLLAGDDSLPASTRYSLPAAHHFPQCILQDSSGRLLLSGNEAVALAALHCGVALGTGYPGTPSTEILEGFWRTRRQGPMVAE